MVHELHVCVVITLILSFSNVAPSEFLASSPYTRNVVTLLPLLLESLTVALGSTAPWSTSCAGKFVYVRTHDYVRLRGTS